MHPVSMVSRPVLLYIAENNIENVENVVIDLLSGEHFGEAFSAVNPSHQVPVLDDDGFILTEASAILKYLADKTESPGYPRDLQARARVNERMDWINTGFYRDYGYNLCYPQVFPHHARPSEEAQQATLEWGKAKAEGWLQILNDTIIGDNAYVCGDAITLADYFLYGPLSLGESIRIDFAKYPNVERWLSTMKALPSFDAVNETFYGFVGSLEGKDFVSI